MKITTSGRFRYGVVGFIGAKPSAAKSFLLRGSIFLALLLLTLFWAWMVALAVTEGRPDRVRAYLRLLETAGILEIRHDEICV